MEMTSLMTDNRNPFLRDYSSTSLLKRNFGVLQIQSQIKQQQTNFVQQYKTQKENVPIISSIQPSSFANNPFAKRSLNAFEMLNDKRNPQKEYLQGSQISQTRSSSESRNLFQSCERNTFYKGLEQLGTREIWKKQLQKQARYKLKHYGAQTLRYDYTPLEKFSSSANTSKTFQSQQPYNPIPTFGDMLNSKDSRYKHAMQHEENTPTFRNKKITSEYYGYDDFKDVKDDDDFPIQRGTTKKSSLKKSVAPVHERSKHEKHSYFSDIPEDVNEDIQTMHQLQSHLRGNEAQDGLKETTSHLSMGEIPHKRSSIDNYNIGYQPESSASSGFGSPSEMYESGAAFRTKFGGSKGGPLNSNEFDEDDKDQNEDKAQFMASSRSKIYPDTLEYNNTIYYKII